MDNRKIEEIRKNETKLINEIKILEQQVKKQKEIINKINEFIKELYDNTDDTTCYDIDKNIKEELLDILKEVLEWLVVQAKKN